jgi:hypothetical protein
LCYTHKSVWEDCCWMKWCCPEYYFFCLQVMIILSLSMSLGAWI